MIYFIRFTNFPKFQNNSKKLNFLLYTLQLLIAGGADGAGVVLNAPGLLLPLLVLLGVEVEVELPPGVHHQLAGTEGTDLVVGQSCLGHQVGLPVEALHLVQLSLILSLPLPE